MFKVSQICRPPHVNIDNLRDDIYQSGFVLRHNVKSCSDLVAAIDKANDALGKNYNTKEAETAVEGKKQAAQALKKARAHNFYLGMDKGWLYV